MFCQCLDNLSQVKLADFFEVNIKMALNNKLKTFKLNQG